LDTNFGTKEDLTSLIKETTPTNTEQLKRIKCDIKYNYDPLSINPYSLKSGSKVIFKFF